MKNDFLFPASDEFYQLLKPKNEYHEYYRQTLIPSHLKTLKYNLAHENRDLFFFEISTVADPFYQEELLVLSGVGKFFNQPLHKSVRTIDFYWLKGTLENIFELWQIGAEISFAPASFEHLYSPQSAEILLGSKRIGFLGCIHPQIAQKYQISEEPVANFPPSRKDLSFIFPTRINYNEVIKEIKKIAGRDLQEIKVFDVYQNAELRNNEKKSVSFHLIFQSASQTLQNKEIEKTLQNIIEKEKEKAIIERFTKNLNKETKVNELAIIGREREIKQLIYILSRMMKNNPLLIGYPGVGKTALVEGLVQRIKQERVPDYLRGKTVYQLDMMSLMAGTKFQGELEERLKIIFNFMAQPENNAILFIDEIHLIVGAGRSQGALDISNLLKPLLSRGEIQCIGATTQEEYRQYIEKDGALVRRFSNILVTEPGREDTLKILQGIRDYFEIYYELKIYDDSLLAAVDFSQRYLTTTYLPDKAIDLLDETCGR
ncbi:24105_t:CDS:2, partial [Racocetra persica]